MMGGVLVGCLVRCLVGCLTRPHQTASPLNKGVSKDFRLFWWGLAKKLSEFFTYLYTMRIYLLYTTFATETENDYGITKLTTYYH